MEYYSAVIKEHIRISPNEVDEPRACYTEWSQSEREKYHILMHIYVHLERWYWWTYLQGSNGDAHMENRLVDTVWEGDGWTNWDSSMETYTLPYLKQRASGNLLYDVGSSNQGLCDNLEGWDGVESGREVLEGGDIYIPMADSCWCMAETNTIL